MITRSDCLKVLVIDDHPVVREGCRTLLEAAGGVELIEAGNADEGLRLFDRQRPDVVLLDINIPGIGGFELLSLLLERQPEAKILMFSMYDNAALAARAIELGAAGYITKNSAAPHLSTAVGQVAEGKPFLDPALVQDVVFLNISGSRNAERETLIMDLLGQGKTLREIASLTGIGYRTVCRICTRLKARLNVSSINALSRLAVLRNSARNRPDKDEKPI